MEVANGWRVNRLKITQDNLDVDLQDSSFYNHEELSAYVCIFLDTLLHSQSDMLLSLTVSVKATPRSVPEMGYIDFIHVFSP